MTTWTPDTDDCQIEISDGRYSVREGAKRIREFEVLAEAEAFAQQHGYEVVDTGMQRGQLVGWHTRGGVERKSKIHATPQDVHAENKRKNFALADVEAANPGKSVKWFIAEDRTIVFTLDGEQPTKKQKDDLTADLATKHGKVRVE